MQSLEFGANWASVGLWITLETLNICLLLLPTGFAIVAQNWIRGKYEATRPYRILFWVGLIRIWRAIDLNSCRLGTKTNSSVNWIVFSLEAKWRVVHGIEVFNWSRKKLLMLVVVSGDGGTGSEYWTPTMKLRWRIKANREAVIRE